MLNPKQRARIAAQLVRCDQAREALFYLSHNASRMERNGKERVYHAALVELHKFLSPVEA